MKVNYHFLETLLKCLHLTIFFISSSVLLGQKISINVHDCKTNNPIEDCFVYDGVGNLIGITNSDGAIEIDINKIYKDKTLEFNTIGYSTVLINSDDLPNYEICLAEKVVGLMNEFSIRSTRYDSKSEFSKYSKFAVKKIQEMPKSHFYNFSYEVTHLGTNKKELLRGNLFLSRSLFLDKGYPKLYYYELIYIGDTLFTKADMYNEIPANRITQNVRGLFGLKYRDFNKRIKKSKQIRLLPIDKNSIIGFKMKSNDSRRITSHTLFNESDSTIISNEFFTPEGGFSLEGNKMTFFYSKELYKTENPSILESYTFIERFKTKEGIEFEIRFEMSHAETDPYVQEEMLHKVRMSKNIDLIKFCKEVIQK